MPTTDEDDDDILEAAALWFSRRENSVEFDDAGLERWLQADPRRRKAFDLIAGNDHDLISLRGTPEILKFENEALTDARLQSTFASRPRNLVSRRTLMIGVSAASVATLLALWGWFKLDAPRYRTGIGEQKTVLLADGSSVTLDANSEMTVKIDRVARNVRVVSGRAQFEVFKDPIRPFIVQAGDNVVTALGTIFIVDMIPGRISVALTEGAVSIGRYIDGQAAPQVIVPRLTENQVVRMRASDQSISIQPTTAGREQAWTHGAIYFDNDTLADAAARMNNYSAIRIEVEGFHARALRVTGQFVAGRSDAFVDAVSTYFPLVIDRSHANALIVRDRS